MSDDHFYTTRWSVVWAAGKEDAGLAAQALEALCETYWFPLYAYTRRRGYSKEDAEDLTQAFFLRFLDRRDFAGVDSQKGKFRAFLLAALKNFLANEWDKSQRQKRGGHITHFSLDWQQADAQFQIADAAHASPDAAYDREWAIALLGRVVGQLRDEAKREGRGERFEQLKGFLTVGKAEISYAEVTKSINMEEGALRVAVHRLRKRYRELLRAEIAHTLTDPEMVEEELAVLMQAFS